MYSDTKPQRDPNEFIPLNPKFIFTYRTGEKGQHQKSESLHYNDNLVYHLSSDIDLEDIVVKDDKFIYDVLDLHKESNNRAATDLGFDTFESFLRNNPSLVRNVTI